jgi:DNA-binding MarR family transcriptional regulator
MIISMVDNLMDEHSESYALAKELFEIGPSLRRILAHGMDVVGDEKTTVLQTMVLFFLIEQPLTISELAKKRKISMQSASVLVQNLVERGWVVRAPDAHDRRRSLLQITPEGMERAQITRNLMLNYLSTVLDELTPEEIAAAHVFISAFRRVLAKRFSPDDPLED